MLYFHCSHFQSLSPNAMCYSIIYQTKNYIRHCIVSFQSVSVFVSHNTKLLYPTDSMFNNYSLSTMSFVCRIFFPFLWVQHYVSSWLVILLSHLENPSLLQHNRDHNNFLRFLVLLDVHPCKLYSHALSSFLVWCFDLCSISPPFLFTISCVFTVCLFFLPE